MVQTDPEALYTKRFTETFTLLQDPRRITKGNFKYPLTELLFLIITSAICGYTDYDCIVDFGKMNLHWLRKYFPFSHGICSHDVLERLLEKINYEAFNECFMLWAKQNYQLTDEELISIDGKRIRGSYDTFSETPASHIVTAFMNSKGICLGQVATEAKSNEITAIPELLNSIDIQKAMVSIDAMGYQRDIAEKIITKEADYFISC